MRIVYVRTTQFRVKRAMNGEKQIPFNMHTYTNTYVHSYTYTCMCTYICMYMLWHEWAVGWTVGRQNENVINKSHFNFLAKKYQNEIHFLRPHCTEAQRRRQRPLPVLCCVFPFGLVRCAPLALCALLPRALLCMWFCFQAKFICEFQVTAKAKKRKKRKKKNQNK